jgi:hypothetical protein
MTTLARMEIPKADTVGISADTLTVKLSDGQTVSVPLSCYPRLVYATPKERNNWRLIGKGHGIHWEDIDEDISVEGLLTGKKSMENRKSLKQWIEKRSEKTKGGKSIPDFY